jgi:superfamily II DNA or RNA helicase
MSSVNIDVLSVAAPELRALEAISDPEVGPWYAVERAVVSGHFLKLGARWQAASQRRWTVVIVDEVHQLLVGRQMIDVLRGLWESPDVEVLVALSSIPSALPWKSERVATEVRWSASLLGISLPSQAAPSAQFRLARVEFTPDESAVWNTLRSLTLKSLVGEIIWQRAGSSFFALAQTLRRQAASAEQEWSGLDNLQLNQDDAFPQDEQWSTSRLPADLAQSLLAQVERIPIDSKWAVCKSQLEGSQGRVGVLTDFADTAEYVAELAREEGLRAAVLTGRTSPASRQREAEEGSSELYVATVAALEGIQLPPLREVIHYDLPWQPLRLYERILAVGSRGGRPPEHVFLVDEESGANWSLPKVLDWVAQVEQELTG